ncbi:hypothetical protein A3Q56_03574 [Intoshia linei]|uniref:Globin domain-containing protein n=1 Tax=Intoshia linei TaxID=1819745 RepID=A0A177B2Y5_9BILA|nr:hypothetical protein A3Q56_03574 [Intoshia linei]
MEHFKFLNMRKLNLIKNSWDSMHNKETSIRFYNHLFRIYPNIFKLFKKLEGPRIDQLEKCKHAKAMGKAVWSSIAHIIMCINNNDNDSIFKCIDYLIRIHTNIDGFHPSMFQLSVKPFLAIMEEHHLDLETTQAYVQLFTCIISVLNKKYPKNIKQ